MIRTRQHADNHVANILKQVKTKQERLLRGYQFAKLYFDIKEYDKAKEYLLGFLSIKDNSAQGFKLLGQILESNGSSPADAAAAYRRSLEVDPQQKDVLLKVCELYCESNISPDIARYWAEKAEKVFPNNDVVYKLQVKAREATGNGNNQEDLIEFYAAESAKCPSDPLRRVKLLRLYVDVGRVNEAYTNIIETESTQPYMNSLEWYRCVVDIFKEYEKSMGRHPNNFFYQNFLIATNQMVALTIEQSMTVAAAVDALWSLDQDLARHCRTGGFMSDEWKVLFHEIEAQYLFHCGVLILNKAQKDRLSWREASDLAYACFLASHSQQPPDLKVAWYAKASEHEKKMFDRWHDLACWRCSQTGHMLMLKYDCESGGQRWIERIQDEFWHQVGKDKIFQVLFTQPLQKDAKDESFLSKCSLFAGVAAVPDKSQIMNWDNCVQQSRPSNLQSIAWMCLHYYTVIEKSQPDYPFSLFESLPYGAHHLDSASPESLCQLDIQAFLFAVVRCSAVRHGERQAHHDPFRPFLLPLAINEKLVTDAQAEWWSCVHALRTNSASLDALGHLRSVLQRGLETVRLVGNHGMGVELVVHLARTFAAKMEEKRSEFNSTLDFREDDGFIQARALHYWNKAVTMLERLEKKRSLPFSKQSLFDNNDVQLNKEEIQSYLDEGRLFQAIQARLLGKLTDAIKLFAQISTPEASFQTSLIYKSMALSELGFRSFNETSGEDRLKQVALLTKAKSALHETLDRLKGDRHHSLNSQVAEEIDDVESRLLQLETARVSDEEYDIDLANTTLPSGVTRLNNTPMRLKVEEDFRESTPDVRHAGSTTRSRLRPSPDRLDAQIRSLTHCQDQWVKMLTDEIRENRATIQKLQERVVLVESKLLEVQEQQKAMMYSQLPPPHLLSTTPLHPHHSMMYPPSQYRPEFDVMAAQPNYDSLPSIFQGGPPLPIGRGSYGMAYQNPTPKGMTVPKYPPAHSRQIMDDLQGESYSYEDDYETTDHGRHDVYHDGMPTLHPSAFPDAVPLVGMSLPALQPGFFSCPPPKLPSDKSDKKTVLGGSSVAPIFGFSGKADSKAGSGPAPASLSIDSKPGTLFSGTAGNDPPAALVPSSEKISTMKLVSKSDVPASRLDKSRDSQDDDGDANDSYPEPQFEAIVTLPEKVDLTTGEENETVMFNDRAKLYRFVNKEWKERGTGVIKILFNEGTGRARVLMRRDQVHKVCANHMIKPDMTIEFKDQVEKKSLTWKAIDCVEEEPRLEQFSCRFKTPEVAEHFLKSFEQAKKKVAETKPAATVVPTKPDDSIIVSEPKSDKQPLFQLPNAGSKPTFGAPTTTTAPANPSESTTLKPVSKSTTSSSQVISSDKTSSQPIFGGFTIPSTTPVVSSDKTSLKVSFGSTTTATSQANSSDKASTLPAFGGFKIPSAPPAVSSDKSSSKVSFGSLPIATTSQVVVPSDKSTSKVSFGGLATTSASQVVTGDKAPSKQILGGFSFSGNPVVKVDEKKVDEVDNKENKPAAKPANPFAAFSFGSPKNESSVKSSGFGGFANQAEVGKKSMETKKDEKVAEKTENKPAPFASFVTPKTIESGGTSTSTSGGQLFGSFAGTSEVSFASLASKPAQPSFAKKSEGNVFEKAGQKLFENVKSPKSPATGGDEGSEDVLEEYEPENDFKPIVSLPIVEVVTGEEKETKIFGERAKLYRMDPDAKQWKERGTGEIKILKNEDTGKFRILMRREQVLKVCANHYITADMKLKELKTSETSWCWFARDFAEEEMREEQLCVKFKTKDLSEQFRNCFEDSQKTVSGAVEAKPKAKPAGEKTSTTTSLATLFAPKVGEWQCEACYIKNNPSQSKCVACETPKRGSVQPTNNGSETGQSKPIFGAQGGFSFGATPLSGPLSFGSKSTVDADKKESNVVFGTGFGQVKASVGATENKPASESKDSSSSSLSTLFMPKAGEWNCNACYVKNEGSKTKCVACETPKPGSTQTAPTAAETGTSKIAFGSQGGFSFGTPQQPFSFTPSSVPSSEPAKKETGFGQVKAGVSTTENKSTAKPATESKDTSSSSLSALFTPKAGEWSCNACYVKNDGSKSKCVACETPKPGSTQTAPTAAETGTSKIAFGSQGGFSFGTPQQPFSFTPSSVPSSEPEKKETSSLPVGTGFGKVNANFGSIAFGSTKPESAVGHDLKPSKSEANLPSADAKAAGASSSFQFGSQAKASNSATSFSFSGQPPVFKFGVSGVEKKSEPANVGGSAFKFSASFPLLSAALDPASKAAEQTSGESSKSTANAVESQPKISGFGKPDFTFAPKETSSSLTAVTPIKSTIASPQSPQSPDGGFYKNKEGEDDHIHFEPIVILPDKVDVKTGEEDEDVLFCDKAKLYRFVGNEWKERGVGDVKLLCHRETKQIRALMRREKVLKICMNHNLTTDMQLKLMPNSQEKAWVWHADDFSEGERAHEQFSLRFRTPEAAKAYQAAFDKAVLSLKSKSSTDVSSSDKAATSRSDSDDCIILSCQEPATELIEQACRLQLPKFFYNYLDAPTCPGCIGCNDDLFDFNSIGPKKDLAVADVRTDKKSANGISQPLFGGSSTTTQPLFGTSKSTAQPIFGGSSATTQPIFGSLKSTTQPIFGSSSSTTQPTFGGSNATTKPLFSGSSSTTQPIFGGSSSTTEPLFGGSSSTTQPLFGSSSSTTEPIFGGSCSTTQPLFGGSSSTTEPIFGGSSSTTQPIFGGSSSTTQPSFGGSSSTTQPIFGGSSSTSQTIFGSSNSSKSLFGDSSVTTTSQPLFGSSFSGGASLSFASLSTVPPKDIEPNKPATIFGNISKVSDVGSFSSFGSKADVAAKSDDPAKDLPVFGCKAPVLDFASITASGPGFKSADESFKWEGSGSTIFGQSANLSKSRNADDTEEQAGDDVVEPSDDIHFQPIVQLAEVEVRTGEEEEDVVYKQRAKLFRFDSNQWKERGVGDMKILKSKITGAYRMLLRRDQVYKVACNHKLTADIKLTTMLGSESAWCWFANDFSDSEPKVEQFAIKFKTKDLADEFKRAVESCQADIRSGASTAPTKSSVVEPACSSASQESSVPEPSSFIDIQASSVAETSTNVTEQATGNAEAGGADAEAEEDEDEEDEETEETPLFMKRATLSYTDEGTHNVGMVDVRIIEDLDVSGYRIMMMSDSGDFVCNHIICRGYSLERIESKKNSYSCQWSAKDFATDEPVRKTFKVTFSSLNALDEFDRFFKEGLSFANEQDLSESRQDEYCLNQDEEDDDDDDDDEDEHDERTIVVGKTKSK